MLPLLVKSLTDNDVFQLYVFLVVIKIIYKRNEKLDLLGTSVLLEAVWDQMLIN